MRYDWRGLDRREREASDRLTLGLGMAWVAVGVVGLIVILITGNTRRLDTAIFWLALGIIASSDLGAHAAEEAQPDTEARRESLSSAHRGS